MGLRINHNLASLNAAMNLGKANSLLQKSLNRLSTGQKINSASDGPADLIISEKMRSQIRAISQATENTETAISMLQTAEGALTEVNALLVKMKGLALKAAQTGTADPEEIAASQAEIDSALASINSIARNTSFGSKFLLDGSMDIETGEVETNKIEVSIERANFSGVSKRLDVSVEKAAEQATASFDLNSSGQLGETQTLKFTGNRGSSTLTFDSTASGEDIAEEINGQTTQTGVTATYNETDQKIELASVEYGESAFVQVEDMDGSNDLLRGELAETQTNAFLKIGNQFTIRAREEGTAGNEISFMYKTNSMSTANEGITILTNTTRGATDIKIQLADSEDSRFSGGLESMYDHNITTTVGDIKALIENNSYLNKMVQFELAEGVSLTDFVEVDAEVSGKRKYLSGGADGSDATAASLVLKGSNASEINFTAKTAGMGGNNMRVVFGTAAELLDIYYDSEGQSASSLNMTASNFNGLGGNYHFVEGNTIFINQTAQFHQIAASIAKDSTANAMVNVTYDKPSETVSTTTKTYALEGGLGISGGQEASAYIDISASTTAGIAVTSTKHGSEGNGTEFIIANVGQAKDQGVYVVDNKVYYVLRTQSSAGDIWQTTAVLSGTGGQAATMYTKTATPFANKFDFAFVSTGALGINYDESTNLITVNIDTGTTTYGDLNDAFNTSSIVLHEDLDIKLGDLFAFSYGGNASSTIATITAASTSAGLAADVVTATQVVSVDANEIGEAMLSAVRANAKARELVDINFYVSGNNDATQVGASVDDGVLSVTNLEANGYNDDVFGEYRFVLSGGYDGSVLTNVVRTSGVNGQVKVNGIDAASENLAFTFDNGDVRGTITLDEDFNDTGSATTFTITGKGAFFQIGQKGQLSYQTGIALKNITTASLGSKLYLNPEFDVSSATSTSNQRRITASLDMIQSGGSYDLAKNATLAVEIIDQAISDISSLRGQVGAFISNTLESNVNSLGIAFENLTASESRIRDVDFAMETAEFTRAQILVQAGTSIAAQANVSTQAALQLLG